MAISLYKVSKCFMLPTGLWKIPISSHPRIQSLYRIYSLFIQTVYVTYNLSMFIRLIELLTQYDLSVTYIYITLTILILEINYKVLTYLHTGIPQMFRIVIEREKQVLDDRDEEMTAIYLRKVKYYKVATFCQCFNSGFGISWFVLVNLYKKYALGNNEDFMYALWFPFDEKKHDVFVTVYNVVLAVYGFLFNCASQTPLQTLMVFSATHLQILQLKLRRCGDRAENPQEKMTRIKQLAKEHQFLIEFVTTLNDRVKYVVLFEFVLEGIHGAGALMQLICVKDPIDIPYCLMYLSLLVVNLNAIAMSAQDIVEQSRGVANAIYESRWPDQDTNAKRLLWIMMMRAQKPLSVDVGPFRPMDNAAALITMKGAYSYSSLMMHLR